MVARIEQANRRHDQWLSQVCRAPHKSTRANDTLSCAPTTQTQSLADIVYPTLSDQTTEHSTFPPSLSKFPKMGTLSTLLAAQSIHSLTERPNAPCRPSKICLRKSEIHTQLYLPTEPYGPWNRDTFQPNCYLA